MDKNNLLKKIVLVGIFFTAILVVPANSDLIFGYGNLSSPSVWTCNDQKPGSAPALLSATSSGPNSITLTWSEASDPVSYYLVAYGIAPNNSTYGNPNVGGRGTTGYTVNNLSGGTNYCFIVRAGNGCTPGDFSNQICTTALGSFVTGAVAPGFTPGVLGVSTPSAQLTATPTGSLGQIQGTETVNLPNCKTCFWWPILLGELIALSIYFLVILRKHRLNHPVLLGAIIPVITYIVFLILNRSCLTNFIFVLSPYFFCRYFILLDAALFALVAFLWKKRYASNKK